MKITAITFVMLALLFTVGNSLSKQSAARRLFLRGIGTQQCTRQHDCDCRPIQERCRYDEFPCGGYFTCSRGFKPCCY